MKDKENDDRSVYPGISLRDHFAGQALTVMLAATEKANYDYLNLGLDKEQKENNIITFKRLKELLPGAAYEIADEMLRARKQECR